MSEKPFKFSYKGALLMLFGILAINVVALIITSALNLNDILTGVISNGILCSIWVSYIISKIELKQSFGKEAVIRTVKIGIVFSMITVLWRKGIYL